MPSRRCKGTGTGLKGTPDRLYPWEIERRLDTRDRRQARSSTGIPWIRRTPSPSVSPWPAARRARAWSPSRRAPAEGRLAETVALPLRQEPLYIRCAQAPPSIPSRIYPLSFISCLAAFDTLVWAGVEPRAQVAERRARAGGRKIVRHPHRALVRSGQGALRVIGIGLNINMDATDMDAEIAGIAHLPSHRDKKAL